jgi:predicted DNA-binding protein (UPF0251 family)/predicted Fe-Mo cluster-binding NifX family protein
MTRPKTLRQIDSIPDVKWFKPAGIKMCSLEEVSLTFDEIEAIRLADLENLYQEQVATRMGVSRQTVGRILVSARKKVAEALVEGKAIRLEGGQIQFRNPACLDSKIEINSRQLKAGQIKQPKQIAITAKGPDLDSEVDLRFGRADYFIIIRLDDESKIVLTNEDGKGEGRGVGIKNSQRLIDAGAEVVVTGRIGPKVMRMMSTQGISIFVVNGGTVREAFEQYKKEQMELN